MLVTLNEVLKKAKAEKYAVGLFNTHDTDMLEAVITVAEEAKSPVIIGTAEVLLPYGPLPILAPALVAAAKRASVPVVVHYDHGLTFERTLEALKEGFSSVMYDASAKDYATNISETAEMTRIAHGFGASIEGEIGHVGSAQDGDDRNGLYTTVAEAVDFQTKTCVDALAVAVGNAHGVYKTKPCIQLDRITELEAAVACPLVMHGGSGLSDDDFRNAIARGIAKVNIHTDMVCAGMRAMYESCDAHNREKIITWDYCETRQAKVEAIKAVVRRKLELFGSIGKACLVGVLALCASAVAQAETLDLAGTWKLTQVDRPSVTCAAAVPGGIYTPLFENGFIPDPYFAQNEKRTQWPGRVEWDFERTFEVGESFAAKKSVTLRLEDVDCFADIYVNDQLVGATSNRFCRWDFNVKGVLRTGKNTIRGRFHSTEAISYAETNRYDRDYTMSNVTVKKINLVRTVACHGGWDWGVTQMETGFMGTVKLIAVDDARLDYVYSVQKFADDYSFVDVEVTAEATAPVATETDFRVRLGDVERSVRVALQAGLNKVSTTVRIERPRLWWPSESGDQPLYDLSVSLGESSFVRRIGLRKLVVINDMDEKPDPVDGKKGRQMTVSVNGKRIFMKGADWIPCDAFENRQRGRYRQHLEDAKISHMNMVRVWGGGQFEHPEFYELCDELGILIWHDFMFSCSTYPGDAAFLAQVEPEIRHQVKNLRDYCSIALWCGDNECIGAAKWHAKNEEERKKDLDICAARAKFLDAICREVDPTRVFWPSSPCLGPGNFGDGWSDDSSGDMHYWSVWFGGALFTKYHEIRPRFCSEFGFQSYPSLETSLTYVSPDQLNPWAPDFFYHQKSPNGNKFIIETMMKYFRFPTSVKSVHYLSQVQQALAIRTGVEHFRSIQPRCMGTIYWQLCDNWPVASWSSIEYGGKWKHLQYHARRFYAPSVLVVKTAYKDPSTLELWAVNDRDEVLGGAATIELWTLQGEVLATRDYPLDVPPRSAKFLASVPIDEIGDAEARKGLFLSMSAPGCPDGEYFFDFFREMDFAAAQVESDVREENGAWKVTLSSDKPAFYVWADVPGIRGIFSDNSFTLLPGRPKTLVFSKRPDEKASFEDFRSKLEVMHLRQTY